MESIINQVKEKESELLDHLRKGELLKGVSIHLNSPEYKNIWNGEIKDFATLQNRIKAGIENGLKSIDYQVSNREFFTLKEDAVLETLTAKETTYVKDTSITSELTAISILWQKINNEWKLAYLHASEQK